MNGALTPLVVEPAWDKGNARLRPWGAESKIRRIPHPCVAVGWLCLMMAAAAAAQDTSESSPKPDRSRHLRLDKIQQAIERGIRFLHQQPAPETFEQAWKYRHPDYRWNQELHHPTGNHALAVWAMLACGESYQDPKLYRRLNAVLMSDTAYTYDRGMRAQMLAELPRARFAPWVHRDGLFLLQALTDQGNFQRIYKGALATGPGDNAHGQYGVLGLAGLQRAGWSKINHDHWAKVDHYWRAAQQKTGPTEPAGWAVYSLSPDHRGTLPQDVPSFTASRGPMTAGAVAVLSVTERALRGPKIDINKASISTELRKGLDWLDHHFSLSDQAEELDRYFYFFTIQSVGRYTGYRTFNSIDWFREVTATMLSEQASDGSWSGPKGRILSTSFALLYLARASDPLAISKVRWKKQTKPGSDEWVWANWNNRPHDLWNFVDYASDRYEVSTLWQIAELDEPLYELLESHMLYIATDKPFVLNDGQVAKLRAYIDNGGLLVTNPDGNSGPVNAAMRKLAERLFGDRGFNLKKTDMDHPIRHIHSTDTKLPLEVVDNGVRPLMVHLTRDVGRDLQRFNTDSSSFDLLSNLYLFLTGKKPHRARLASHYVQQANPSPQWPLSAARIKYQGNFDPEPVALMQLKAVLANKHDVDLRVATVPPAALDKQAIAFLTTVGPIDLDDQQVAAVRKWLKGGGTLWIDIAGGHDLAIPSVRATIERLAPGIQSRLLGRRDAIISGQGLEGGYDCRRVRYRSYALRLMQRRVTPQLETVEMEGRPAIVFSTMDLTGGLVGLDHWGIFGYEPESARRLVINGCLAALRQDSQNKDLAP